MFLGHLVYIYMFLCVCTHICFAFHTFFLMQEPSESRARGGQNASSGPDSRFYVLFRMLGAIPSLHLAFERSIIPLRNVHEEQMMRYLLYVHVNVRVSQVRMPTRKRATARLSDLYRTAISLAIGHAFTFAKSRLATTFLSTTCRFASWDRRRSSSCQKQNTTALSAASLRGRIACK